MEIDNLLKCPKCGKVRKIVYSTFGYLNIKPGISHRVRYIECKNPNCTRKKRSYLITESPIKEEECISTTMDVSLLS